MGMTVKVKMNLDFPVLEFQRELMEIANKVIIPDIEGRIDAGVSVSGHSYGGLDPKTIKQKQRKGLSTKPLIATGQLRRSSKAITKGENSVVIFPSGIRHSTGSGRILSNSELGDILQNQGVRSRLGKRFFEFFGISKEAEIEAMDFMAKTVKKRIRDGGRKTVR
jgi:hypothetical protein